jgi:hypothetical protein
MPMSRSPSKVVWLLRFGVKIEDDDKVAFCALEISHKSFYSQWLHEIRLDLLNPVANIVRFDRDSMILISFAFR